MTQQSVSKPPGLLSIIVFSQFAGTALWFAGNAVLGDLQQAWNLPGDFTALVLSSVQLGFIFGTFLFALFNWADRFSPRKIFCLCVLLGALFNLGIIFVQPYVWALLVLRFATGLVLAGVYPVGMKIAASWYQKGLGLSLGYLVGALVLGSAFPYAVKAVGGSLPWIQVLISLSLLAVCGGLALFIWVPDGPYLKKAEGFYWKTGLTIFSKPDFRAAAFGYWGHMWELYAFWAFLPLLIKNYLNVSGLAWNENALSFVIIAVGFIGCVLGGYALRYWQSMTVARFQVAMSGLCCISVPLFFKASPGLFFGFLLLWGITVVGDSPQFSTLTAQTAPPESVGTALTLVTSLGFGVTILSIQGLSWLKHFYPIQFLLPLLGLGPLLALLFTATRTD